LIYTLKKDSTLSETSRESLDNLEIALWNRKNVIENTILFIKDKTTKKSISSSQEIIVANASGRNDFWFLVSTSGIYIIMAIIMLPVLLFLDKKSSFFKSLATYIIFALVMGFTAWFNYWLFSIVIPDNLWGNWIWNYITNAIVQIGLIIGLYWSTKNINQITDDI
jgi:uncharacterized membrane-anchored protein